MVRGIERQESIIQTNLAERIQQIQQQHPDLQQRYFQIQLSQERRKLLHKVNESADSYKATIGDEEGKKNHRDETNKRETSPDSHQEDPSGREPQSHIDIEV